MTEPRLLAVQITDDEIVGHLMDGRTISVPLTWSCRLSEATTEQRQGFVILGDGHTGTPPDDPKMLLGQFFLPFFSRRQ